MPAISHVLTAFTIQNQAGLSGYNSGQDWLIIDNMPPGNVSRKRITLSGSGNISKSARPGKLAAGTIDTCDHPQREAIIMTTRYSTRQLAAIFQRPYHTVLARIRRGWPLERALTTPLRHTSRGPRRHGCTGTREYRAWQSMKYRCSCPQYTSWHRYGGRGLSVCDLWQNDFMAFLRDVGPAPSPKHSLGRIRNDGNYEPGNIAWQTVHEQAANRSQPCRRRKT